MRAERDVVLQIPRVVDDVALGLVVAVLDAEETEFAVAPRRFDAVALRIEVGEERAAVRAPELVVAVAEIPRAIEAIHGFEICAAPVADPGCGQRIERIAEDFVRLRVRAVALVEEKLAAQCETAVFRVA